MTKSLRDTGIDPDREFDRQAVLSIKHGASLPHQLGPYSNRRSSQLGLKSSAGLQFLEALCALEKMLLVGFLISLAQSAKQVLFSDTFLRRLNAFHNAMWYLSSFS